MALCSRRASVMCDNWYVPHLANRDTIYVLDSTSAEEPSSTDFVIVREDLEEEDQKMGKKRTRKTKKRRIHHMGYCRGQLPGLYQSGIRCYKSDFNDFGGKEK